VSVDRCVTIVNGVTRQSLEPRCAEISEGLKKVTGITEAVKKDFYIIFEHCLDDYHPNEAGNDFTVLGDSNRNIFTLKR